MHASSKPTLLHLGTCRLDVERRQLLDDRGERVELRHQALELLMVLAARPGEVVGKEALFEAIWPGVVVTDDSLVQAVGDARRALGDGAHRLIQTVPRRGYRLLPEPVSTEPAPGVPELAPAIAAATAAPGPLSANDRPARPGWRTVGLAGLVVLCGFWLAWRFWGEGTPGRPATLPDRPPLAVLSFQERGASASDQAVARAYAEELVGELARNADLHVVSAASSLSLADSDAPLPELARQLKVGYLVDGQLRREGDRLRLAVQLVHGTDGRVVWHERHDMAIDQVFAVRDALVNRIAGTLHSRLRGDSEARAGLKPPASMDVYAMTLRGISLKHRYTPEATREARELLERATTLEPAYAPGWLYLGYVNIIDQGLQLTGPRTPAGLAQAQAQIERAIALAPHLPSAYAALQFAHGFQGRHEAAVESARRCVELGPSDAECHIFLAAALTHAGRPETGLAHARQAMALSPLPPAHVLAFHARTLWGNGLLDETLAAAGQCLQQAPMFSVCRIERVMALAEAGRLAEAREELQTLQGQLPTGMPAEALAADFAPVSAEPLRARRLAALRAVGLPSP